MNLIKYILFLVSFSAFSQVEKVAYPAIIVYQGDTLLAFTTDQGRKLSVLNEERKECIEINKDLIKQKEEYQITIREKDKQLTNLTKVKADQDTIINSLNENLSIAKTQRDVVTNQRNNQRAYKWTAIGVGSFTTLFMSYLFITK